MEDLFFGYVSGFEVELGYFSLKDLQQGIDPMDLPIERDLSYEPKSQKELMALLQNKETSKGKPEEMFRYWK